MLKRSKWIIRKTFDIFKLFSKFVEKITDNVKTKTNKSQKWENVVYVYIYIRGKKKKKL